MFRPRGIPEDLDDETADQVARSFLVVRLVKGTLLLLFLAIALVAVELEEWPQGIAVAIGLALLLQVARLVGAAAMLARVQG